MPVADPQGVSPARYSLPEQAPRKQTEITMSREIIRVEPLSTWLERWKAPTSAMTKHGDTLYVSGFPPFDPGNR